MHMVWHDDKITHHIPLPIKKQQGIGNNSGIIRLPQFTGAVAVVQQVVIAFSKGFVIGRSLFGIELFKEFHQR